MAETGRTGPSWTTETGPKCSTSTQTDPTAETVDAAAAFQGYAVLVRGAKSERRHLYLTIAPAERVVRRARARGDLAELVLVRLVPVGGGQHG